ncbi:O-unit flippase-like protein, partial [Paenibacillus sp. P3E]|uniref:O-unit flippase-like protein n=1 Tax=Paenibacillus sp. P3E TaxID=1349435 RepID=UPI00273DA0D9
MIPLIGIYLSSQELGLWYTMTSLGALAYQLDFGFLPTITRNITYCWSGASDILKEGISEKKVDDNQGIDKKLMNLLLHSSKRIYLVISVSAFLVLSIFGSLYLLTITTHEGIEDFMIAWLIYCIGIFLNIYYEYWSAFLRGTGLIKESQKAQIIAGSIQLLITSIGLFLHLGLIAISISFFVSGLVLRQISRYYFYKKHDSHDFFDKNNKTINTENKGIISRIWHNAWKSGLTSIGTYIITQGTIILSSTFLGLEMTASYGLTLQLFSIVATIASIPYNSYLPAVNEAQLRKDKVKLVNIISFTTVCAWLCYIIGWMIIVFVGKPLLEALNFQTPLLTENVLLYMGLYLFLEFNHSYFGNIITT